MRYEVGVTGKGGSSDVDKPAIKSLDPNFRWFVYNSGTDNYVDPPHIVDEHELLVALATARGWDPEEVYLHYYDDTRVVLQGDTLLIRGWGGGSATSPAESRVPVYYKDLSRRVVNFSTRRAAQLNKEAMVQLAFDTPFTGSKLYPDGIFLDNSSSRLANFGTILSGGRIGETSGSYTITSQQFKDWYWNQNFAPFLTALKDTLGIGASWSRDGQRKYLMINVANVWDDSYVSRDVADILFMEFQYNPVRNAGLGAVDEAYRRDKLAAASGIACVYAATMTASVAGRVGNFTYGDAMMGNLAWYLTTRTPSTYFYEMGTSLPSAAGWDSLTWRGCLDVANEQLGEAIGGPYTLARGIDPMGNPYLVKARHYDGGLVVLRNRGQWNQGVEPQTAIRVQLPSLMLPVATSGRVDAPVRQVVLRNGQGAILLNRRRVADPPIFKGAGAANAVWVSPNPSRGQSTIHFGITTAGQVRVRVVDVSGREVVRLFDRAMPPGEVAVTWNGLDRLGSRVGAGIYLFELETPTVSLTRKLLLLR